MKLTKHRDGTYSLTDMTSGDLTALSIALLWRTAASHAIARGSSTVATGAEHWRSEDDKAWQRGAARAAERLYDALQIATRWPSAELPAGTETLPRGASIELTSDRFDEPEPYRRIRATRINVATGAA